MFGIFSKKRWIYHVVLQKKGSDGVSTGSITAKINYPLNTEHTLIELQKAIKEDSGCDAVVILNWIELKA